MTKDTRMEAWEDMPSCRAARSRQTDLQLSMLKNSFQFYHAWHPSSMESLDEECHDGSDAAAHGSDGNGIVVKNLPPNLDDDGLRDFFSLFGPISNATISDGVGTVTFEGQSEVVERIIMETQPIKIGGEAVEIERAPAARPAEKEPHRGRRRRRTIAPFPIVVAPPNFGPLHPVQKVARVPEDAAQTTSQEKSLFDKATRTMASAAAKFQSVAPSQQHNLLLSSAPPSLAGHQRKASLHSLLVTEPSGNSLFEDDEHYVSESSHTMNASGRSYALHEEDGEQAGVQTKLRMENNTKHFHCDDSLLSWVFLTEQQCPSELSCALVRGHAVNAEVPLLATVSGAHTIREEERWIDSTNLSLLHIVVDAGAYTNPQAQQQEYNTGKTEGTTFCDRDKLYRARHPCLAPLISVSKRMAPNKHPDRDQPCSSAISVFDITPSRHRSLHEMLRTDDFFTQPLFPGVEGHEFEPLVDDFIFPSMAKGSPLRWLRRNIEKDECTCHKASDQGDGRRMQHQLQVAKNHSYSEPNLLQEGNSNESDLPSHYLSELNLQKLRDGGAQTKFIRQRLPWKQFKVGSAYRANIADLRIRFLALQLFNAVSFCHAQGVTLGELLSPDKLFLQEDGWMRLVVPVVPWKLESEAQPESVCSDSIIENDTSTTEGSSPRKEWRSIFKRGEDSAKSSDRLRLIPYPGYGAAPTSQWQKGQLSNLCYIMMLNAAAGRRVGDLANPPILPWVTDFSSEIDLDADLRTLGTDGRSPWRDLSKSKFRLHKGDEQLDQTFTHASPPHHLPECICELTYTVYRARCLPIEYLRKVVRKDFNPGHYPSSIKKIYEWTPDEATIEFYADVQPNVFCSIHEKMDDLALPPWCKSDPQTFIAYHRRLLESDFVSRHLHLWIDLNFGEALSGKRAVTAKNLPISAVRWGSGGIANQCQGTCRSVFSSEDEHLITSSLRKSRSRFVQLFSGPHPRKHSLQSTIDSVSLAVRSAFNQGKVVADGKCAQVPCNSDSSDFLSRKQRDISTIGAILKECYVSARAIPPPAVDEAIDKLMMGTLDLRKSLKNIHSKGQPADDLFPFPYQLKDAYRVIYNTQNLTLERRNSESELEDGTRPPTLPSTHLERVWSLIQTPRSLKSLPSPCIGLLLQTVLSPLKSIDAFVENCAGVYCPSFSDRLSNYVDELSSIISADLIIPEVFNFMGKAFDYASNSPHMSQAIMEELGKIFLSSTLLSSLYSSSSGEFFLDQTTSFITEHLCNPPTPSQSGLLHTRFMLHFISILAQDVLGPGLFCKYIVPSLVHCIEGPSPIKEGNKALQALEICLPFLPADAIGILISKPLVRKIIPAQLRNVKSASSTSTTEACHFLIDLTVLLQSCLSHLDSSTIVKYYIRANPDTILQLLITSFGIASLEVGKSEELLREAGTLVSDVIDRLDANHYVEILPVVERFASHVNDTYLSIVLHESVEGQGVDRKSDAVMSMPGIGDTLTISKKAVDVCGREQLKANCPSVLEFLSWFNEACGIHSSPHLASISSAESLEKEGDAGHDSSVKVHLDEGGDGLSLEMRAPKRWTKPHPAPEGDKSDNQHDMRESLSNLRTSRESNRFQPTSQPSIEHDVHSSKRDLAWLLGLHKEDARECQVKYSWHCRMMLATTLEDKGSLVTGFEEDDAVTICMSANRSESFLSTGTNQGEVLLYDLRRQPPTIVQRKQFGRDDTNMDGVPPIRQVEFFHNDNSLLVCNGGLHLYNLETQRTTSSLSPENTLRRNDRGVLRMWKKGDSFVGFSLLPNGTSVSEILGDGSNEIAAISSSYLYTIDLRCSDSTADYHRLLWKDQTHNQTNKSKFDHMFKALTWNTGTKLPREEYYAKSHNALHARDDNPTFNLKCIASHSDWICTGSTSGHIHCFDRRQGMLLHCWKGHMKSVEHLSAVSRHRLLSVGADKSAVLWDMTTTPPKKISGIYNIPGKESSMNVTTHQFREDGLVSIPGESNLLLCAAAGRKAVFSSMPQELPPDGQPVDVPARRLIMSDYEGTRIPSSGKPIIRSVALLPCRQLVLLGCEDGDIHVCL